MHKRFLAAILTYLFVTQAFGEVTSQGSDNRLNVSASFIGLLPFVQAGARVGYSVQSDLEVAFTYQYYSYVMSPWEQTTYQLSVRKFWGESFYSDVFGGTSSTKISERIENKNPNESKTWVSASGESWLLGLTLGNRFNINDNLYVGINWVSFGYPIARKSRWKASSNSDADDAKYKDFENELETKKPSGTFQALGPYLGWIF